MRLALGDGDMSCSALRSRRTSCNARTSVPTRHSTLTSHPSMDTILRGEKAYRLVRRLGHGGQGAVYEAEELEQHRLVAIKLLHQPAPDAIERFKREFRTRELVRHPSLVTFGELACWEGTWFLTMSLVRGVPLLEYLKHAPDPDEKLRECFAQLAASMTALHEAGLVHRDVKSDNVLVDSEGRVVLVDLGLVLDTEPQQSTQVIGTPAAMAPELWADVRPSAGTDWYAFGVLLFEAICRVPPFAGSALEVFLAKTQRPPPRPLEHAPGADLDLIELCDGLLCADPVRRYGQVEVLRCLNEGARIRGAVRDNAPRIVGREQELEALTDALESVRRNQAAGFALIFGASGIGKTTLLKAFGERAKQTGALLLPGRCYQAESLPYKAFDEAFGQLAKWWKRAGAEQLRNSRPRHAALLSRIFPALSVLGEQPGQDALIPVDPVEVKMAVLRALVDLLKRVSETNPVVICVDDLQWADADSLNLLDHLSQSDASLLLVATAHDPYTTTMHASVMPTLRLDLPPLGFDATQRLANEVCDTTHLLVDHSAELHQQTGGSPYLICEWASFVKEHGFAPALGVSELLAARIRELTWPQQQLLALVAICNEPIECSIATRLTGATELSDVTELVQQRLLRTLSRDGKLCLDLYHMQIRVPACALLQREQRREMHRLIAVELEQLGAPPERCVAHQMEAGDRDAAAQLALQSARGAQQNLAFVRAAELYDLTLKLLDVDDARTLTVAIQKAQAWQYALRPLAAGEAFLDASQRCTEPDRARELLRLAGEQLLLGGNIVVGLATLEQALRDHRLALAATPEQAIAEAMTLLACLEARGLEQASGLALEPMRTSRVALCLSLARCLHHVDLRGIPFAVRGLLEAMEVADLSLLQQAQAVFIMVTASHLPNGLIPSVLERCRLLTTRSAEPYAHALYQMAIAEVEHFRGQYTVAERACERAERTLLSSCVGVSRELGQVRSVSLIMAHSNKGDFRSHFRRAIEWLDDADRRGDVFHGNWLRVGCSLAWMALDQPERARADLRRAEETWPAARGGTFEAACVFYLDALDRYQDRANVYETVAQSRPSIFNSLVAQTPLLQGFVHLQRGWGCLRELGARGQLRCATEREVLREGASKAVASLRALEFPIWRATADAFEANLLHLSGAEPSSIDGLLESAIEILSDAQLLALAACARRRRGELTSTALADRWLVDADVELERLGVKMPVLFARAYFSPYSLAEHHVSSLNL